MPAPQSPGTGSVLWPEARVLPVSLLVSVAAPGSEAEHSCAEEPLDLLTAALGELRASLSDPTQQDGEARAAGRVSAVGVL